MSATPQPVAPKAQLTYSVTVTNHRPANSGAVKVVQSLPAKSTFVMLMKPVTAPMPVARNNASHHIPAP